MRHIAPDANARGSARSVVAKIGGPHVAVSMTR
jgi:hypothetical protein